MTDIPVPVQVKGGAANQQKQLIMLAVLGVVFLLAVVFFVIKPFGGDDTAPAPTPDPAVTTPSGATGTPASPSETTPPTTPIERPARNPFG